MLLWIVLCTVYRVLLLYDAGFMTCRHLIQQPVVPRAQCRYLYSIICVSYGCGYRITISAALKLTVPFHCFRLSFARLVWYSARFAAEFAILYQRGILFGNKIARLLARLATRRRPSTTSMLRMLSMVVTGADRGYRRVPRQRCVRMRAGGRLSSTTKKRPDHDGIRRRSAAPPRVYFTAPPGVDPTRT